MKGDFVRIYDRLYGELRFPSIILDLLDCPGLLRLRDVRMANNQFVAFPAFASASRYEHSLGVCYLAGLCADSLNLLEKEKIELMMACLYHDVGTPPFAHAMEEVLQAEFGFDHEENLKNLIMGTTENCGGDMARVFQGQGLRLGSVCQSKKGRALQLNRYRIAKIAAGDKTEWLSPLLNGNGMDLDNIDNIIRASTAMGLIPQSDVELAPRLARAFVSQNKQIYYDGNCLCDIRKWQQIRDIQYTAIFDSVDDFSYQTMIKKALRLLMRDEVSASRISAESWNLTDSEIVHDFLLMSPHSREIMTRVLLCKPYCCLGVLYIKGKGITRYINSHLDDVEFVASEHFIDALGINRYKKDKDRKQEKMGNLLTNAVVANFYPDKRKRALQSKALAWNKETIIDDAEDIPQGALLGLFTPLSNSNYRDIEDNQGITRRKLVSYRRNNLNELIDILSEKLLRGFEVSVYGSDLVERTSKNFTGDQLEFF